PFFLSHSGTCSSFSSGGLIKNLTNRLSLLKRSSESDLASGGIEKMSSRKSACASAEPPVYTCSFHLTLPMKGTGCLCGFEVALTMKRFSPASSTRREPIGIDHDIAPPTSPDGRAPGT